MTRLVLVKHSKPEITPSRPANEWALSKDGESRCGWLVEELSGLGISTLYTSPEPKAQQTAEIVSKRLGIDATVCEGLHENDRTEFLYINNEAEWKQRLREFFAHPAQRLIGNESANESLARFSEAVSWIVALHANKNVGVVAHGTVISLFIANENNVSPFEIWESLNPLPAYLSVLIPSYEIEITPKGYPT